jgi:hypothetical protein
MLCKNKDRTPTPKSQRGQLQFVAVRWGSKDPPSSHSKLHKNRCASHGKYTASHSGAKHEEFRRQVEAVLEVRS